MLLKGRALPAYGPIPPDIAGYDPNLKTHAQLYDPGAARALLDRFGYKDRDGDGYRETPGRQAAGARTLVDAQFGGAGVATSCGRRTWMRSALRIVFRKDKLPELRKMARHRQDSDAQRRLERRLSRRREFHAASLRAERRAGNNARFNLPGFNQLYDDARELPDSTERTRLFDRMTELVVAYSPWRVRINEIEDTLAHPWVRNYVPHPMRNEGWMYMDVDVRMRARAK